MICFKGRELVKLPLDTIQEAITIYPPTMSGRQYVFYIRSKVKNDNKALGLSHGDNISVSFFADSHDECLGMLDNLLDLKVVVLAAKDLPLQQTIDTKTSEPFFRIKAADAYTIEVDDAETSDEEKPRKRKK